MLVPPVHAQLPRVAIVDIDRRVQQSLSEVLRIAGGVEVVGTAGDVRGALELIERQRPEVVVVDPRLPDVDAGAALLASIGLAWPATRIVLTGWADASDQSALVAGAAAYVGKSDPAESFVAAVVNACSEQPSST